MNGADGAVASYFVRLTPQQTTSFLASEIDPGTTGFAYAFAIDESSGCPLSFNHLIGDESVKLASGHRASFAAEVFSLHSEAVIQCESGVATLRFDGIQFTQATRVLALHGLSSRADGPDTLPDTLLIVNRLGGDLTNGVSALGELAGLLFDDTGRSFAFASSIARCQFSTLLNETFPPTVPRFPDIVPASRLGWLKLWETNETALLGVTFNLHPRSFGQGHLLHKLTLTNSARLLVPVSPPTF